MSSWQKVDLLALPFAVCTEYYVKIESNCKEAFKCAGVLAVLTPSGFVYCSDVALADDDSFLLKRRIAITEYYVLAVLSICCLRWCCGCWISGLVDGWV